MALNDPLADALSTIYNHEFIGKLQCIVKPASRVITGVLKTMQKEGYIGDFELIDNGRGGVYRINLTGKITKCQVVKPRYHIKVSEIERYERRFLPASGFGILILTTPKGIMSNKEAKKEHVGGALLAYVY